MAANVRLSLKWPFVFALLALVLGLWLLVGGVSAGLLTSTKASSTTPLNDAYMLLLPEGSAPPNGGTITVGNRFVLGLWLDPGSHIDATAQQSYFTFTWPLLQNAAVPLIATSCVLTSVVAADQSTFDTQLQNEACNGPRPCDREGRVLPGMMAYASGCLGECHYAGRFRLARIGLCAVAPGMGLLHWQFTPPDPIIRDTEIADSQANLIHNRALFTDYVINITTPTNTPTITPTSTSTPTPAPGPGCRLAIPEFYACMDTNGCGSFSVRLLNQGDTGMVITGTAQLLARSGVSLGDFPISATYVEPHATTYVGGTICPPGSAPGPYRIEVTIRTVGGNCPPRHKSQPAVEGCT